MDKKIYDRFSDFFSSKLINEEVSFPDEALFDYETIEPIYRVVEREKEDWSPVTNDDFKSYCELKKKPRGKSDSYKSDPKYYGVSTAITKEYFKQVKIFPRPNKKVAVGKLYKEAGPIFQEGEHICWWLYKDIKVEGFVLERK